MRVRIIFDLENKGAVLPFHHQFILNKLIEEHFPEESKGGVYDKYNFSGLKGQTKISREGLHYYSSKVTLVFSTAHKEVLDKLIENIFKHPKIELGDLKLVPHSVDLEDDVTFKEETKYICISPVVIIDPTKSDLDPKKFITPENDKFSDLLYDLTMERLEKSGRFTEEEMASFFKFQLVPDMKYLRRIKESQKKFARIYPVYSEERHEIRGYTFPFTLYADPKVQRYIFESGLGCYTGYGFGMLDLADTAMDRKTTSYYAKGGD